nr:amidophosphoribosyltransferase [Actinomarinicola tropica]
MDASDADEPHHPEVDDVDPEDDTPKEACGVFGVYAPGQPVAHLTYLGLFALQHRGQESAGMAVSDGESITVIKEMGLVANAFDERMLVALSGHLAIGHVRYSTTGSSVWRNSQPSYRDVGGIGFALGHNGNLVNTRQLADEAGMLPGAVASDTDVIAELLSIELGREGAHASLESALMEVVPRLEGAFSLTLQDADHLIGVRDPNGFRPLCLGRLDNGWVLASESPALDIIGAVFIRELDPGEMVVIDADGPRSSFPFAAERTDPTLCIFEFVYFSRPDSRLYGRSVHQARIHMGEQLAEQMPVDADMVMGVPESGLPAAEGYSRRSGIPYGQGLVKNRYIGRTFIAPSQELRAQAVRMKLNPLRENIEGKRVVVIDDSIVRGTTTRAMIKMLREAGATEVHMRVSSPPYRWPCFYGMDTGTRGELLAANLSVEEIRDFLGADTLAYLSLDRLVSAIDQAGTGQAGFCDACLTGSYPVEIPVSLGKGVLEGELLVPSDARGRIDDGVRVLPVDEAAAIGARRAEAEAEDRS